MQTNGHAVIGSEKYQLTHKL